MTLSVVIITYNEEANIGRTLESVQPLLHDPRGDPGGDDVIVVDSGSTDRTVDIATSFGARVFVEDWKGYAAQKNCAIERASGRWILSLDADEALSPELVQEIRKAIAHQDGLRFKAPSDSPQFVDGFAIPRKNFFMHRWIKHGGFYPDRKVRLFLRGKGRFGMRPVHETAHIDGRSENLHAPIVHHSYPTLSDFLDHMNRYSSLGAEMVVAKGPARFSVINIVLRPWLTFIYNYFFRLGFLDGREGLLLHLYHAVYVSWKYAKAWELGRQK
ncbi:MAG TPA: glycosyltransferase family 2 protein [Terriglobales bacterium]|nr:glycosyltransferase family 2 protein [Terriglobales bacterium]